MTPLGILVSITLIVTSFLVAAPASVIWLRLRELQELKYFSALALGTFIAHLMEAVGVTIILLRLPMVPTYWSIVFLIPAAVLKVGVWSATALFVLGIINGIHPSTLRKNDTTDNRRI